MAIENSEFSHKKRVIFHSYVKLPEGMTGDSHKPKQPNKTSRFLLVHTRPFLACVGHG